MAWTKITRPDYDRRGQHYASDMTDREWALVAPHMPELRHIFADGGYAGPKLKKAARKISTFSIEIIKRSDHIQGFEVLPRRWVVERTFAWLNRCRRLAKDFEKSIASATAWIIIAQIRLLSRRIARYCY